MCSSDQGELLEFSCKGWPAIPTLLFLAMEKPTGVVRRSKAEKQAVWGGPGRASEGG